MILNRNDITVAYRCPVCGCGVVSLVNLFALNADMVKLKCECGESELTMVYSQDKKLRFSVPCLLCPKPHNFTVTAQTVFDRDLFLFPCPLTGVDVCFLGKKDAVLDALAASDEELNDLLGDDGEEEDAMSSQEKIALLRKNMTPEEIITDPQVFDIVNFVLQDLHEEGKIYCRCTEKNEEGDLFVEITNEGVLVRCKTCGAENHFPVGSVDAAYNFLEAEELHLL